MDPTWTSHGHRTDVPRTDFGRTLGRTRSGESGPAQPFPLLLQSTHFILRCPVQFFSNILFYVRTIGRRAAQTRSGLQKFAVRFLQAFTSMAGFFRIVCSSLSALPVSCQV
jgi:hypothetical protein